MSGLAVVTPPPAALVFWDIVEESFDEAEFLWGRRDAALEAHDRTLAQVEIWIEERLLGALEGLCVAGPAAVDRMLAPTLEGDDCSRIAASAYALLSGGTAEGAEAFTSAFIHAAGTKLAALRRGLELVADGRVHLALAASVKGSSPAVHAAFLDACAFRGLAVSPDFGNLLASASADIQKAAARLLRFAPAPVQREWLARALNLKDRAAHEVAVETGLVAGFPGTWALCCDLAGAQIWGSAAMLLLAAMLGSERDHKMVLAALATEGLQRDAIWALGLGGRRSGADACVELLAQDRHVKLAAEAFCAITGLDLSAAGLVAPPVPEADEPIAFEQEDLDADLEPRPEELLPTPDVGGVIRWWNQQRPHFDGDSRYMGGRPASFDLLYGTLVNGPMRRRHAAAVEMAIRTEGRIQVQTRALVPTQRRQMAAFAGLPREAFSGSFARGMAPPGRR
jgi:uncharacterized protein (TIGR02270 family)